MSDDAARYFLHPQTAEPGHRALLLLGGEAAYPAMLAAIEAAREEVLLETYIWRADGVGRRFAAALVAAARRGARVCAIRDAVGSFGFDGKLLAEMGAAGVKLAEFHPVFPFRRSRLTVRDHRKLLVVDGVTAFLGGMNIADDYAPESWGGAGFYDVHLRVDGPQARTCARLFALTWRYAAGERLAVRQPPAPASGGVPVQILAIDSRNSRRRIRQHYEHALKRARRSVVIMAAYFIPDRGLRAVLRKAVGRGVEVRVLLPHHSDVALVQHASRFTYGALLRDGVQLYEWLPGMMHAKTIAVDSAWLAVGSYNLDRRSLLYNWELAAAVADPESCRQLEAAFETALKNATRITRAEWKRRGLVTRLLQWAAYLFRNWL